MTDTIKDDIRKIINSTITGDTSLAAQAFHDVLSAKMRSRISGVDTSADVANDDTDSTDDTDATDDAGQE